MKSITYKDAGVDVTAGNELARRVGKMAAGVTRPEVVSGIGGFAGICSMPAGMKDPLLVSGTDGVGTKLKVAMAADRHHTVGQDLVAMCANDIITVGADPLFFLDYLAVGKLDPALAEQIIQGVVDGCKLAGCALLGGETAEMPGMYGGGEYDMAGFVVGVVERDGIIDGSRAEAGDAVVGLPSSGLHSNGYSLVRRVLMEEGADLHEVVPELGRSLADELLEPTRIYARAVKRARESLDVRALAHITGGGLVDNPPRCVNDELAFRLRTDRWEVPAIMTLIAERGGVAQDEMRRTFNMGLGMLLVVPASQLERALEVLADDHAVAAGELIQRADQEVEFIP